jgi:hypothetical protein
MVYWLLAGYTGNAFVFIGVSVGVGDECHLIATVDKSESSQPPQSY